MPRLQVVEMNYLKMNSSGNVEWQTWCRGGRLYKWRSWWLERYRKCIKMKCARRKPRTRWTENLLHTALGLIRICMVLRIGLIITRILHCASLVASIMFSLLFLVILPVRVLTFRNQQVSSRNLSFAFSFSHVTNLSHLNLNFFPHHIRAYFQLLYPVLILLPNNTVI